MLYIFFELVFLCLTRTAASGHVNKAAARGFELEDIDADGDGNIDFQAESRLNCEFVMLGCPMSLATDNYILRTQSFQFFYLHHLET